MKEDGVGGVKFGNVVVDGKIKEEKKKKEKVLVVKKESDIFFSVLDIRVGVINKVWKYLGVDVLYVEEIDIGEVNLR